MATSIQLECEEQIGTTQKTSKWRKQTFLNRHYDINHVENIPIMKNLLEGQGMQFTNTD